MVSKPCLGDGLMESLQKVLSNDCVNTMIVFYFFIITDTEMQE